MGWPTAQRERGQREECLSQSTSQPLQAKAALLGAAAPLPLLRAGHVLVYRWRLHCLPLCQAAHQEGEGWSGSEMGSENVDRES